MDFCKFWVSFLATIMVDHFPLCAPMYSCRSFGASTEASTPAVLSIIMASKNLCVIIIINFVR